MMISSHELSDCSDHSFVLFFRQMAFSMKFAAIQDDAVSATDDLIVPKKAHFWSNGSEFLYTIELYVYFVCSIKKCDR